MTRGMTRPGVPVLPGILVLVGVLVAAAGCGGSGAGTAAVSASGSPSSSAISASGPSLTVTGVTPAGVPAGGVAAGGGGSAGDVAGGGAAVARCPTSRLSVASTDSEGAAGSTYERLLLTNTGSTSCVLGGFPGVSYVDAAGRQIGAAADRTGPAGALLTLGAGSTVSATLRTVHIGLRPGCEEPGQTKPAAALLIYPPGDTAALRLPLTGVQACSDPAAPQLSVTSLTA